jgi:hypothetical protein
LASQGQWPDKLKTPKLESTQFSSLIEFHIEIRPNRGGHRGIAFQKP